MRQIAIPLRLSREGFQRTEDLEKSISSSLTLLLQTPCYSCVADSEYGFILRNLRFENFNENDGTLDNVKVSGSSKNANTFASELKDTIVRNEPRLSDVNVTLTYIREEKTIYVSVKGVITDTGKPYQYQTTIRIWK